MFCSINHSVRVASCVLSELVLELAESIWRTLLSILIEDGHLSKSSRYKIQAHLKDVDFVVSLFGGFPSSFVLIFHLKAYEKNDDVGGTWHVLLQLRVSLILLNP